MLKKFTYRTQKEYYDKQWRSSGIIFKQNLVAKLSVLKTIYINMTIKYYKNKCVQYLELMPDNGIQKLLY
jgi:hypothetical protein